MAITKIIYPWKIREEKPVIRLDNTGRCWKCNRKTPTVLERKKNQIPNTAIRAVEQVEKFPIFENLVLGVITGQFVFPVVLTFPIWVLIRCIFLLSVSKSWEIDLNQAQPSCDE